MRTWTLVVCLAAGAAACARSVGQQLPAHVRAVNAAAAPGGDGTSWATAFGTLQAGLDAAAASGGSVTELWLAQGEYSPMLTPGNCATVVLNGLSLYGGFAGTEFAVGERPPGSSSTIQGSFACQYSHMLIRVATTDEVTIDGITLGTAHGLLEIVGPTVLQSVSASFANSYQYGLRKLGEAPIVIRDCDLEVRVYSGWPIEISGPGLIESSYLAGSHLLGSGMHLSGISVRNSEVGGFAEFGGLFALGVNFEDSVVRGTGHSVGIAAERCIFRRSVLSASNHHEGTAVLLVSSQLDGCEVGTTNYGRATIAGGVVRRSRIAMRATNSQQPVISLGDASVWESELESIGGGGVSITGARRIVSTRFLGGGPVQGALWGAVSSSPRFINCLFQNQDWMGGNVPVVAGPGWRFTNCIIWPEQAGAAGVISAPAGLTGFVNHSIVRGWTGELGGVGNSGADPMLNADGTLMAGSPAIDAGDTAALPPFSTHDLAGKCRLAATGANSGAVVDIGPLEFGECMVNCDCSLVRPALNIADLVCYMQRYAAGDPWANCDGSTVEPLLTAADFACFMQWFALGCAR